MHVGNRGHRDSSGDPDARRRREAVRRELKALSPPKPAEIDAPKIKATLDGYLADWTTMHALASPKRAAFCARCWSTGSCSAGPTAA